MLTAGTRQVSFRSHRNPFRDHPKDFRDHDNAATETSAVVIPLPFRCQKNVRNLDEWRGGDLQPTVRRKNYPNTCRKFAVY